MVGMRMEHAMNEAVALATASCLATRYGALATAATSQEADDPNGLEVIVRRGRMIERGSVRLT